MGAEEKQRQYMIGIVNSIIYEAEIQRNNLNTYASTLAQVWKGSEQASIQMVINTAISELNSAINTYYNVLSELQSNIFVT